MSAERYSAEPEGVVGPLLLLAYALLLWTVGTVHLGWLLWIYVPAQAAVLEGAGGALPRPTQWVLAASRWWVRILPFLYPYLIGGVLTVIGAAVSGVVVVAYTRKERLRQAMHGAATFLLVAALLSILGSVFVVHAIQAGHAAR